MTLIIMTKFSMILVNIETKCIFLVIKRITSPKFTANLLINAYWSCSKNLQLQFIAFEKFLHHLEKALHKQIQWVIMARYQQLIKGIHGYLYKPVKEKWWYIKANNCFNVCFTMSNVNNLPRMQQHGISLNVFYAARMSR